MKHCTSQPDNIEPENPSMKFDMRALKQRLEEKEKELKENPPALDELRGDRLKLKVDTQQKRLTMYEFDIYRFRKYVMNAFPDGRILGPLKLIPHKENYGFTIEATGTRHQHQIDAEEPAPNMKWHNLRDWEINYRILEELRRALNEVGITDVKKVIWPSHDLPEEGPEVKK